MKNQMTLQQLLSSDPLSRQLYDSFTPDQKVALQEQMQSIHTREELEGFAASFQKQQG